MGTDGGYFQHCFCEYTTPASQFGYERNQLPIHLTCAETPSNFTSPVPHKRLRTLQFATPERYLIN